MVEWTEDSLEELLDKSIGDIREMLAHEDSDSSFRTFLIENGWIEDTDNEYDDNYDEEEDDEEDYEDDDYEEEDDDIELPSDQEELAEEIANDIDSNKYTIDSIVGFYSEEFVERVRQLLD